MRRGLMIAGIILLVIGIAASGWSLYANWSGNSISVDPNHIASIDPSGVGPFVSTVRWSGATTATTFYVSTTEPVTCLLPPSGVVATGTGTNGSVSLTLNAGTTYYMFACNAGTATINITVSMVGLSTFVIIGVILIVLALILVAFGRRPVKKMPPPPVA